MRAKEKNDPMKHCCPHCNLGFIDLALRSKHAFECRGRRPRDHIPNFEKVEHTISAIHFIHAFEVSDKYTQQRMYVCSTCYRYGHARDVEPVGYVIPEFCPECGESSIDEAKKHIAFMEGE